MPNKNAFKRLQSYGELAIQLNALDDQLDEANYGERKEVLLNTLVDFVSSSDVKEVVGHLAYDHYSWNREIAASIINYLWVYWKTINYKDEEDTYDQRITEYCDGLKWTIPHLEQLIQDKCGAPAQLSIFAAREMEYVPSAIRELFRTLMKKAMTHKLSSVRLEAVRNIQYMYDIADEGHEVDDECMKLLVQSTYDTTEEVRDWACFILWFSIENRSKTVEAALWDAYRREDVYTDVYMEAVIGLASYGNEGEVTETILENLKRDDCGTGWIDAVRATNSMECWVELRNTYERLKLIDVEGSHRLSKIEEALDDPDEVRMFYRPVSSDSD